jgi:hypothetical protein
MGAIGLLWLVSLPAFIALVVKVLRLAIRPALRAEARRRWLRTVLVFGLLVPASLPCVLITVMVWQYRAEASARHVATHLRLDAPTRIAGIDLPAGSQLQLRRDHVAASFEYADFPEAIAVYGVMSKRIFRELDQPGYGERADPTLVDRLVAVQVAAERPSWVDGWHCQASPGELGLAALRFTVDEGGASATLARCRAAPGNLVAGHAIPVDSQIEASVDVPAGQGPWRIVPARAAIFPIQNVPVFHTRFTVDAQRRFVFLEYAELACRLSLGGITYPAGTEVSSADEAWRARFPGAWTFVTAPGRQAMRDGQALEAGASVVQSLDGRVHAIVAAAQTPGPFARFAVAGEPAPGPPSPESSCDAMMSSWPTKTVPSSALTPQ